MFFSAGHTQLDREKKKRNSCFFRDRWPYGVIFTLSWSKLVVWFIDHENETRWETLLKGHSFLWIQDSPVKYYKSICFSFKSCWPHLHLKSNKRRQKKKHCAQRLMFCLCPMFSGACFLPLGFSREIRPSQWSHWELLCWLQWIAHYEGGWRTAEERWQLQLMKTGVGI